MKYSYASNKLDVLIIWIELFFSIILLAGSIILLCLKDPVVPLFCSLPILGIAVISMIYSLKDHTKYLVTEEGLVEKTCFVQKMSLWSDYYYWGVFQSPLRHSVGVDYICLIKSERIPTYPGKRYYFVTSNVSMIDYSEERYLEIKEMADKHGIQQLTKNGKGKQYGAVI